MAATFGAPVASIVLATELLLFEFSTRAFIPRQRADIARVRSTNISLRGLPFAHTSR